MRGRAHCARPLAFQYWAADGCKPSSRYRLQCRLQPPAAENGSRELAPARSHQASRETVRRQPAPPPCEAGSVSTRVRDAPPEPAWPQKAVSDAIRGDRSSAANGCNPVRETPAKVEAIPTSTAMRTSTPSAGMSCVTSWRQGCAPSQARCGRSQPGIAADGGEHHPQQRGEHTARDALNRRRRALLADGANLAPSAPARRRRK